MFFFDYTMIPSSILSSPFSPSPSISRYVASTALWVRASRNVMKFFFGLFSSPGSFPCQLFDITSSPRPLLRFFAPFLFLRFSPIHCRPGLFLFSYLPSQSTTIPCVLFFLVLFFAVNFPDPNCPHSLGSDRSNSVRLIFSEVYCLGSPFSELPLFPDRFL